MGALKREGSGFHNTELTPFLSPLHLHPCLSQWLTCPAQKEFGPFWAKPFRKCSSGVMGPGSGASVCAMVLASQGRRWPTGS